MNFTPRTGLMVRNDTNAILETIKTHFYSSDRLELNEMTDPNKYDACMLEIDRVVLQIKETCPDFTLEMRDIIGLLTLAVNGLVVAACTITKKRSPQRNFHSHIEMYCTIGNDTTQRYLLEEAERISLAHDLKMMTIDAQLSKLESHLQLGFFPISIDDIWRNPQGNGSKIVTMIDEANEEFESNLKDAAPQRPKKGRNNFARNILIGVLGSQKTSILEHHDPGSMYQWNADILRERTDDLVSGRKITLSKRLLRDNFEQYPVKYKKENSVISSLGEATSRFLDLVDVNIYDLEDNFGDFNSIVEFEKVVCRGAVLAGYIRGLRTGRRGDILVMTAEVSGVAVGLCILEFVDIGHAIHKPYMYIHLVCAREHTGIGKRIFSAAERFALQNGVDIIRLSALPNVVHWYQKMSFETGHRIHGNDPERVENLTPRMDKVLPNIIKTMNKLEMNKPVNNNASDEMIEEAKTEENFTVMYELLDFMKEMYGPEEDGEDNKQVLEFSQRYDFLMILYARHLNLDRRGSREIRQVNREGIHMSKDLKRGYYY